MPIYHEETEFDKKILEMSPDFCMLYREAETAEAGGLSKICGTGYRKALEFLIKDFVISFTLAGRPDAEKDKVKQMGLAACIGGYITNEKIKLAAERAVWLGNDQTHYTQLWEDKDLTDLKRLVNMTVSYIRLELDAAEYMKDMPRGKHT
jgi:hypothetical protein